MKKNKKTSSLGSKILKGVAGTGGTAYGLDILANILQAIPMKDGGRVKGVGKATHGYGKAMKKQGKK